VLEFVNVFTLLITTTATITDTTTTTITVTIGYGYIITRPSLITITAAITTITHTVITRGVSGVPHTYPTPPAARRPGASRASRG